MLVIDGLGDVTVVLGRDAKVKSSGSFLDEGLAAWGLFQIPFLLVQKNYRAAIQKRGKWPHLRQERDQVSSDMASREPGDDVLLSCHRLGLVIGRDGHDLSIMHKHDCYRIGRIFTPVAGTSSVWIKKQNLAKNCCMWSRYLRHASTTPPPRMCRRLSGSSDVASRSIIIRSRPPVRCLRGSGPHDYHAAISFMSFASCLTLICSESSDAETRQFCTE